MSRHNFSNPYAKIVIVKVSKFPVRLNTKFQEKKQLLLYINDKVKKKKPQKPQDNIFRYFRLQFIIIKTTLSQHKHSAR